MKEVYTKERLREIIAVSDSINNNWSEVSSDFCLINKGQQAKKDKTTDFHFSIVENNNFIKINIFDTKNVIIKTLFKFEINKEYDLKFQQSLFKNLVDKFQEETIRKLAPFTFKFLLSESYEDLNDEIIEMYAFLCEFVYDAQEWISHETYIPIMEKNDDAILNQKKTIDDSDFFETEYDLVDEDQILMNYVSKEKAVEEFLGTIIPFLFGYYDKDYNDFKEIQKWYNSDKETLSIFSKVEYEFTKKMSLKSILELFSFDLKFVESSTSFSAVWILYSEIFDNIEVEHEVHDNGNVKLSFRR